MTGTPEAISDPPMADLPRPHCCPSHGSHSSFAGWGTPKKPLPGRASEWWAKQPPSSLRGPSSRSSVQMPEQGHSGRGTIQMVTVNSGSVQGIRKGGETQQRWEVQKATGLAWEGFPADLEVPADAPAVGMGGEVGAEQATLAPPFGRASRGPAWISLGLHILEPSSLRKTDWVGLLKAQLRGSGKAPLWV